MATLPEDLLSAARVGCHVAVGSKKRVLEKVSELLAADIPGLTQSEIFDRLIEREKLGSTGLGHGVALPHGRMREVSRAYGALLHLENAIDFDAIDGQPVDLVFALLVPESATEEHLQLLGNLAGLFSDETRCQQVRESCTPNDVMTWLTGRDQTAAPAA